ncbi:MAG: 3-deoxy-D-manno-octulosonic acid transferase, partial [Terracidiphilus sp.]
GPHYANFRAITEELRAHDGIRIAAKEDLARTLGDLLRDPTTAAAAGGRARQVFDEQAGATERTVCALEVLLAKGHPCP